MLEIKSLDDIRGNNVVTYSIKTLLLTRQFPKLAIMAGVMGVGKTSVANIVAKELDQSGSPILSYNFGMAIDMEKIKEEVFSLSPSKPRVFIFEELHGLPRQQQNALLQMFDNQAQNVYVICTTTELNKVIAPLRSRAQVWEFKLLSDKQLAQLLDDYLESQGQTLAAPSKVALLKACHGVPRDLIKNTDFALSGNFNGTQLDALLGNVSDQLIYSIFCSLKSNTTDFVANIEGLLDDVSSNKLSAMNDFWLRYLLERSGGARSTLTSEMIKTLDKLYTPAELNRIAKMLLRCTPDTLLLELVSLNMTLTETTSAEVLGQQKDRAMVSEREAGIERQHDQIQDPQPRISSSSLRGFKL